jgi:hypothetical protein
MLNLRTAGLAGAMVISALVGGTLISAVAASTATPSAATVDPVVAAAAPSSAAARDAGEYCATFRAAFAANLGVSDAEMVAAARKAAVATVDKAVTDGDLTTAEGDRVKARIAAAPADGCALLNGWRGKVARAAVDVARDGLTAAADVLKLTPAEVRTQLRDGKSLKDIATAQNVPYNVVNDAIVKAVKADLDAAVAAGNLKQARVDRILERLERRLADGRLRPDRPVAQPAPGG